MPLEILHNLLRHLDRLLLFFGLNPLHVFRFIGRVDSLPTTEHNVTRSGVVMRPLHDFQKEVASLFTEPCSIQRMQYMSRCLREDYLKKLQNSTACMLPSFCHTLPTGAERGTFIALDVGGSTFRVAVVDLNTRSSEAEKPLFIKHMTVHKINERIRQLCSSDFFSWMAGKMVDTLQQCQHTQSLLHKTVSVGLAWSFPIEQTGYRGGTVQPMGKGFKAHEGIVGHDLGDLIEAACQAHGLSVRVNAIVNDSSATLLSQAYLDSATTLSLILGTGTNAAVYLPVKLLGKDKFGMRNSTWFQQADSVIINTEVSMFGKNVLPVTRWDALLNEKHVCPNFQPLEYMTTGRYLGEIFRLLIAEAVETCHMFDGLMPIPIQDAYTLDTALLAAIEEDTTIGCISSAEKVQKEFHLPRTPTAAEMAFLRSAVEGISHRSAAYMATAIHALWSLDHNPSTGEQSRTTVAANGSVISMYPGFRTRCQQYVNDLIASTSHPAKSHLQHELTIQPTEEATILGVAVAVSLCEMG